MVTASTAIASAAGRRPDAEHRVVEEGRALARVDGDELRVLGAGVGREDLLLADRHERRLGVALRGGGQRVGRSGGPRGGQHRRDDGVVRLLATAQRRPDGGQRGQALGAGGQVGHGQVLVAGQRPGPARRGLGPAQRRRPPRGWWPARRGRRRTSRPARARRRARGRSTARSRAPRRRGAPRTRGRPGRRRSAAAPAPSPRRPAQTAPSSSCEQVGEEFRRRGRPAPGRRRRRRSGAARSPRRSRPATRPARRRAARRRCRRRSGRRVGRGGLGWWWDRRGGPCSLSGSASGVVRLPPSQRLQGRGVSPTRSRLLQVALHLRLGARLGLVRVLAVLPLRAPLPEQVPALVEVGLELADAGALLRRCARCPPAACAPRRPARGCGSGCPSRPCRDPARRGVTAAADLRHPALEERRQPPGDHAAGPARRASRAARSSGTRTSRRPVARVPTACPSATSAGHGRSRWASTRASASAVGPAFASTIAVTNAGSLPMTRVPSRKLPAARPSASGPASAAAAASAAASRWGTWLIAATASSCSAAVTGTTSAPTASATSATRSHRGSSVSGSRQTAQRAPVNSPGSVAAWPDRSVPHIGWPPTNRPPNAAPRVSSTGRFTEPRSVIVASGSTVSPSSAVVIAGSGHGEDDDAVELLGDLHAPGGRGVAGRRVDVPAGDRPAGRSQRRGERAAELTEPDDRDRRHGQVARGTPRSTDGRCGTPGRAPWRRAGRPARWPRSGRPRCGCCGAPRRLPRRAGRPDGPPRGTRCARPGRWPACRGCCSPPRGRRRAAPSSRRRAPSRRR